ncbi:hypothetical protein [Chryseobacterium joostei]|uniref:hypothetical protein n=1 Tax=Chryseobacterium joostei TaxID=112234 RepID=UPI0013DE2914|nr:hypothetical protein [Chryseobacterium joostei]
MFLVLTTVTSFSASSAIFFLVSVAIPSPINKLLLSLANIKETKTSSNPTITEANPSNSGIFSEWLSHIITVTIIKPEIFNITDYSLTFQKNNFK